MADEQGAGASNQQQSSEGQQPDAGASQEATTQAQQATPEQKPDSANRLIKDFAKARGVSVEELLTRYGELEDSTKTEQQRLIDERDRYKTDYERLQDEIRDSRAESAFVKAATEANARDAETLYLAFKSRLEFSKDGTPKNVADVVTQLQKDKPALFVASTGSADGGRRGESTTDKFDINDAFRDMAKNAR